jgi:hypothetical protein
LPLLASDFSAVIAEKSRVKEVTETVGAFALGLELAPEPEEGELLAHAAAMRLTAQAPAERANFLAICFKETTLFFSKSRR